MASDDQGRKQGLLRQCGSRLDINNNILRGYPHAGLALPSTEDHAALCAVRVESGNLSCADNWRLDGHGHSSPQRAELTGSLETTTLEQVRCGNWAAAIVQEITSTGGNPARTIMKSSQLTQSAPYSTLTLSVPGLCRLTGLHTRLGHRSHRRSYSQTPRQVPQQVSRPADNLLKKAGWADRPLSNSSRSSHSLSPTRR